MRRYPLLFQMFIFNANSLTAHYYYLLRHNCLLNHNYFLNTLIIVNQSLVKSTCYFIPLTLIYFLRKHYQSFFYLFGSILRVLSAQLYYKSKELLQYIRSVKKSKPMINLTSIGKADFMSDYKNPQSSSSSFIFLSFSFSSSFSNR